MGKHINELRRKANDKQLASRAKSLVKKWRELLMPTSNSGSATPVQTASKDPKTVIAAANQRLHQHQQTQLSNGHSQPSSRLTSPAVSSSSRLSPGLTVVSNVVSNAGPTNIISNSNQKFRENVNNHNSSSLPSSASSSPGLSRPTTPSLGSRPVSPAVPKTHVSNKRLRKEEDNVDGPVSKKAKMVNGTNNLGVVQQKNCDPGLVNGGGGTITANSTSKTTTKIQAASDTIKKSSTLPSSASITRKKKQELEREKILEEKINSAKRQASKVRTTQELVQELALRSSSSPVLTKTNTVTNNQSNSIVSETKTELMNRFFESQTNTNGHSVLSPPLSDGAPSPEAGVPVQDTPISNRESVEDVLAQLPPIDVAAVLAEINTEMQEEIDDDEDDEIEGLIPVKKPEPLSESVKAEMVQELHSGQHESVNGNFTHDGAFKEWHEVVSKETLSGDLLYILPYSVIE